MNGDERPIGIEDLVDVDLTDASADQQPSAPWSDADRDDAAMVHRDYGINQIATDRPEPRQNSIFVRAGESAIADHIRD
jgi:hypothetical protein